MSVTRWEKGRSKRGVNPTHMISWHTPLTPLSEVAKAITGEQGIKKVIKLLLRAGCGTRPSREGRAEGGVGYKGPLIFIRAATRLPGALFDRRPQPGARLWLQLRDPPPYGSPAKYKQQTQKTSDKKQAHTCIHIATAHVSACRVSDSICFVTLAVLSRVLVATSCTLLRYSYICFDTFASTHLLRHICFDTFASCRESGDLQPANLQRARN